MRVVLEIETHEEMQQLEQGLQTVKPSQIRLSRSAQTEKLRQFMQFRDVAATAVAKITIPDREERNAR